MQDHGFFFPCLRASLTGIAQALLQFRLCLGSMFNFMLLLSKMQILSCSPRKPRSVHVNVPKITVTVSFKAHV